jgi:exosome complex component RRP42
MLMSDDVMTEIQRDHLFNLILKGEREDGRAFDEFREISIETDVIDTADGSARVKLGKTELLVGVKIQPGEPFPDTPDKGVIITNAELIPLASPEYEAGPPREGAIEIARVVDRGIRESKSLDLEKLCITAGEKVWIIFIDIHVLNNEGNILDAASMGGIAALLTAKLPCAQYGMGDDIPLPVRDIPVAVTVIEFGGALLLDPSLTEGAIASTSLITITNSDGSISGMQKSGSESLTIEQVLQAVDMAKNAAAGIREKFLEV